MKQAKPPMLQLSKFDVAERQLNQAVAPFFFREEDPVSIHTLTEAAAQVLYDLREKFGGTSLLRDNDRIRDEYKHEWNASLVRSRNFFKHADRDPNDVHEFREEFNHFSLIEAVNLYLAAKRSWTPESVLFFAWFMTNYPKAIKPDPLLSGVLAGLVGISSSLPSSDQRWLYAKGLADLRSGSRAIAGISLKLGLPE
jgi:hypothetical protein